MPSITTEPVVSALRTVLDPEVGINVIDLGLVYGIEVHDQDIRVTMTMTSSACPLGAYLRESAERAIREGVPGARTTEIALVWKPVWNPSMMSPEARRQLGWRG